MSNEIISLGYARKSPDDPDSTETSITNQIKLIEEKCKEFNWNLKEIFIDKNISGSDRTRKEFLKMIKLAIELKKAYEDVYIIVKEQDRFCRDSPFFQDTLTDLEAYGIKLYSILRSKFLSSDDLGDVVTSMVDNNSIIVGRKKAFKLLEQKKKELLPSIPAPFGYKYSKDKKNKNWIIETKKAEIVKNVVSDYINKVKFRDILKNNKIDKNLYYRIIKNANKGVYSGFVSYVKKFKDSNKKIVRVENVLYKGSYESIISLENFKILNKDFQIPNEQQI